MKALVTGANGFLGSWLVKKLLSEGHEVTALVRPSSDLSELRDVNCKYVYGDVTEKESLVQAFNGMDTVFHLAGLIAYKKTDRLKMEKVNVQGTRNVVEVIEQMTAKQKPVKLLYLSSVVAIGAGYSNHEVLNEQSPYNISKLNLGYFETKHAAEKIVVDSAKAGRIHAVCVNPSTIYGAGDAKKGSRKTQIKVAQGKFKFYTPGGVNVVSLESVLSGILSAVEKGRSGERYILAGQNFLIKDLFAIIAAAANVPAPRREIPKWLLHVIGFCGDVMTAFGAKTSLSSETAWTSSLFHWFDSSKAQRELDFVPGDSKLAIQNSVRWMKENGLLS